jgi:hypothetical protein
MNKKKIMTLGILWILLLPARGYTQNQGGLWGGVALGGGFFEHDGKGTDSAEASREAKPGLAAGGHLGYVLHQHITLHVEVLFATKGSHHFVLGEKRYSYSLNYLELPLLARVSLPSIKDRLVPFVTAGPMTALLLSASGEDVRLGEPLELDGVWKSIDFGVIFGAGAALRISQHDLLGLEFRYDMGLRAIEHDRDTINNRGLLLVLQYQTCICSRSAAR